jgi:DNA end-binding protein Ku
MAQQTSRASSTAMLNFADFHFPIKLFAVAQEKSVSFVKVHNDCGARLRQESTCTVCMETSCTAPDCKPREKIVPPEQRARALQMGRGNLVPFSEEEILSLRSARTDELEISEFHAEHAVESILFAKAFYVAPGDGGAGYELLRQVMARTKSVGLGRFYRNGDVRFVLVQRYGERGLLLRELFQVNEVRSFPDLPALAPVSAAVLDKALDRVETMMQSCFRPEAFIDPFPERLLEAAEKKLSPASDPKGNVAKITEARSPNAIRSSQAVTASAERVSEGKQSAAASVHVLSVKTAPREANEGGLTDREAESQRSGSPGA